MTPTGEAKQSSLLVLIYSLLRSFQPVYQDLKRICFQYFTGRPNRLIIRWLKLMILYQCNIFCRVQWETISTRLCVTRITEINLTVEAMQSGLDVH